MAGLECDRVEVEENGYSLAKSEIWRKSTLLKLRSFRRLNVQPDHMTDGVVQVRAHLIDRCRLLIEQRILNRSADQLDQHIDILLAVVCSGDQIAAKDAPA